MTVRSSTSHYCVVQISAGLGTLDSEVQRYAVKV
jgi:hypothetical protein